MGISIAKDEFFPKPKVEKKNETDGSIFYYPRANDPRKNCQNSIVARGKYLSPFVTNL